MTSAAPALVFPQPLLHEVVSRRARELWEKQGCPHGRDEDIWLEAERSLQLEASAAPSAPLAKANLVSTSSLPRTPSGEQAMASAKIPPLRAPKNVRRDF